MPKITEDRGPYPVPAIAVPTQTNPEIWWERPADDHLSDGHDLYAILESREEAERYGASSQHQADFVRKLIDKAWPQQ